MYHSLARLRVSRLSSHDRGLLLGFWIFGGHRNHGLGRRGGVRPCAGSSLDDEGREIGRFDVAVYDHGDEYLSGRQIDLRIDPRLGDRGQYRSAMRLMEECAPTVPMSEHPFKACFPAHLNLEQIVSTDTLVVHLVVSIICITATLVLDERKASRSKKVSREVNERWM